jgi:hypothetical protein
VTPLRGGYCEYEGSKMMCLGFAVAVQKTFAC